MQRILSMHCASRNGIITNQAQTTQYTRKELFRQKNFEIENSASCQEKLNPSNTVLAIPDPRW